MQANTETLRLKIGGLEESLHIGGALSLNQEYQLEAYKMLLALLRESQCKHEWFKGRGAERRCADCGKGMPKHD